MPDIGQTLSHYRIVDNPRVSDRPVLALTHQTS